MRAEVGGDGKETAIMGYDTTQNVYTRDGFNSQGQHQSSKGTVSGDTWPWTSEANYGGTEVKQRFTTKILSPTTYRLKFEVSVDGTDWTTFTDGTAPKKQCSRRHTTP